MLLLSKYCKRAGNVFDDIHSTAAAIIKDVKEKLVKVNSWDMASFHFSEHLASYSFIVEKKPGLEMENFDQNCQTIRSSTHAMYVQKFRIDLC